MSDQPAHAVECLKADGLHSVWLIAPPGRSRRTLKTWPLSPWMALKLALGIAQPQRQLRGMRRLRALGIRTPQSVSPWRARLRGNQPVVELELEFAPGRSAWDLVSLQVEPLPSPDVLRDAARTLGSIVARLALGNVFHRDLKISNVVVDYSGVSPRVWLIDTVGVRRMRDRATEVERMLERLAIQPMSLPQPLARQLRMAVMLAALRPLSRQERHAVCAAARVRRNAQKPAARELPASRIS